MSPCAVIRVVPSVIDNGLKLKASLAAQECAKMGFDGGKCVEALPRILNDLKNLAQRVALTKGGLSSNERYILRELGNILETLK